MRSCSVVTSIQSVFTVFMLCAILMFTWYNKENHLASYQGVRQSPEWTHVQNSDLIRNGILSRVQITGNQLFAPNESDFGDNKRMPHYHRQISLNLRKQLSYREQPPQSKFQWLFNDKTTLIYSAHYDNRDSVIKLIGFKHRFNVSRQEPLILCRYPDNTYMPMTTLYNVSVFHPRPGLEYNTWIWQCSVKDGIPPTYISLTTQSHQILIDKIFVTYYTFPQGAEKVKRPIICVKPMVKRYNDSYQLREFIEVSRLWGVSKIVLYPYSIDTRVILPILDKYKAEGLVDVHEWQPPVPAKSLHAYGQKTHNQHCLYTYMYRYQWAAFIDLDELIVSDTSFSSLEFMIQSGITSISDVTVQAHVAGFVMRSQMCTISIADDPLYSTIGGENLCKITSMRKTNCTPPMKPGVWSKPLVNTDGTEIVDIHKIRLPRPSYSVINMDPSIGTVHHYRALKRNSAVLAQSNEYNVLRRNTHLYMNKAKEKLGEICRYNNPNIGDVTFVGN